MGVIKKNIIFIRIRSLFLREQIAEASDRLEPNGSFVSCRIFFNLLRYHLGFFVFGPFPIILAGKVENYRLKYLSADLYFRSWAEIEKSKMIAQLIEQISTRYENR